MSILNTAQLTSKITSDSGEQIEVTNKSNIHRTNIMDNDITIVKSASKYWAIKNDTLKIFGVITNSTNTILEDITITEIISEGANFKPKSLKIGSQAYEDLDPTTATTLPITIGVDAEMKYEYEIVFDEYISSNEVTNSTKLNVTVEEKQFEINSNEISIKVLHNDVSLLKTANTTAVKSGDEITYTITISNSGTILNTDLFFQDQIPARTTFVEGSVKVDGTEQTSFNPNTGFSLKNLDANESIVVEFKVTVN